MTIAVFGGSFDPPHIAHVLCAHYVLAVEEVDKVLVVPVFDHAFEKTLTPYDLRIEMCESAFYGDPRISVSQIERELPAPSYTLHTLIALKTAYPNESFRLIMGEDVASETAHWRNFEELARLAPPLVVRRVNTGQDGVAGAILPAISSSEIRDWCKAQSRSARSLDCAKYLPKGVLKVMNREPLYR